jgi:hypothetical protein
MPSGLAKPVHVPVAGSQIPPSLQAVSALVGGVIGLPTLRDNVCPIHRTRKQSDQRQTSHSFEETTARANCGERADEPVKHIRVHGQPP